MRIVSKRPGIHILLSMVALSASTSLSAQQSAQDPNIVVNGAPAPEAAPKTAGPEIKGVIAARKGDTLNVVAPDGTSTTIAINDATQIKGASGLFGANRTKLAADSLLNGLPVTVKTWQGDGQSGAELVASQISFRNTDLKTANMIRNGTSQRFAEQSAATEALRGHMGDIDKYNVKSTTNVHFDTGRTELSAQDKADLCNAASTAQATENALMLVVGYTDATGGDDLNQTLSEKRAARVINYLQQNCGWKPYRMLTPTGMAKADPLASNDTAEGKAQNRRVAVNILVSKSLDGL
jgi:outer membrane protein OmpA-like peptidoglycan-associated protein